jgi:hypothetical protein
LFGENLKELGAGVLGVSILPESTQLDCASSPP